MTEAMTEQPWMMTTDPIDRLSRWLAFGAPLDAVEVPKSIWEDIREDVIGEPDEDFKTLVFVQRVLCHAYIPMVGDDGAWCVPVIAKRKSLEKSPFKTLGEPRNAPLRRFVCALLGYEAELAPSIAGVLEGPPVFGDSWNLGFLCAALQAMGCFASRDTVALTLSACLEQGVDGLWRVHTVDALDAKYEAAKARFGERLLFVCCGALETTDPRCVLRLKDGCTLTKALALICGALHGESSSLSARLDLAVARNIHDPDTCRTLIQEEAASAAAYATFSVRAMDGLDRLILARARRLFGAEGGDAVEPECLLATLAGKAPPDELRRRLYALGEWERCAEGLRFTLAPGLTDEGLPEDNDPVDWEAFYGALARGTTIRSLSDAQLLETLRARFDAEDFGGGEPPLWRTLGVDLLGKGLGPGPSCDPFIHDTAFDVIFGLSLPLALWRRLFRTRTAARRHALWEAQVAEIDRSHDGVADLLAKLPEEPEPGEGTLAWEATIEILSGPNIGKVSPAQRFPLPRQRRLVRWTAAVWAWWAARETHEDPGGKTAVCAALEEAKAFLDKDGDGRSWANLLALAGTRPDVRGCLTEGWSEKRMAWRMDLYAAALRATEVLRATILVEAVTGATPRTPMMSKALRAGFAGLRELALTTRLRVEWATLFALRFLFLRERGLRERSAQALRAWDALMALDPRKHEFMADGDKDYVRLLRFMRKEVEP